jgi:hypothetical protein
MDIILSSPASADLYLLAMGARCAPLSSVRSGSKAGYCKGRHAPEGGTLFLNLQILLPLSGSSYIVGVSASPYTGLLVIVQGI